MDTPGYLAAIAACRRSMISACSRRRPARSRRCVVRPNDAGLFGEVRDAIVNEVRADVEKHEQKRHERKGDEQEDGDRADQDVGKDELAAHPPEQPGPCERGNPIDRGDGEDDEREVDGAIDRDVLWSGKPHQHLERDGGDPESRNGANDITRPSTLESSPGTPRCRRRSASR